MTEFLRLSEWQQAGLMFAFAVIVIGAIWFGQAIERRK